MSIFHQRQTKSIEFDELSIAEYLWRTKRKFQSNLRQLPITNCLNCPKFFDFWMFFAYTSKKNAKFLQSIVSY